MRSAHTLVPLTLAVAAVAGCGGSGSAMTATTPRIDIPGARWAKLSDGEQRETVLDCRLATAVRVARSDGAPGVPLFSDRYRAVQRLDEGTLNTELDRWFADPAHGGQTVRQACAAIALRRADIGELAQRPHVEFGVPVTTRRGPLELSLDEPSIVLTGRLSPARARLTLERPADRARSTARWTIRQRGDAVTVALRGVPLGVSYLQVNVDAPTGRAARLLVVTRSRTPSARPPRTFAPVSLKGTTSRTLSVLDIPRPAIATVRSAFPLAVSTSRTLLLAHSGGRSSTAPVRVRPGLYHDVRIAATGPWTLRIVPVR
jgi:hypothetical protein